MKPKICSRLAGQDHPVADQQDRRDPFVWGKPGWYSRRKRGTSRSFTASVLPDPLALLTRVMPGQVRKRRQERFAVPRDRRLWRKELIEPLGLHFGFNNVRPACRRSMRSNDFKS